MFAGSLLSKDGNAAADTRTPATTTTTTTTTTHRPTSSTGKAGGGPREGRARRGGEWSPPPSVTTPANGKATAGGAAPGQNGDSSEDDGPATDEGMWGYRSSLSSKACWKVDAWASARKDTSVELDFDSVAFDLFVTPEDERGGRGTVAAAPAATVAGNRAAARHDHGKSSKSGSSRSSDSAPAVVFNVVPFRLVDGLPRELGPLLFSADEISSLISVGGPDDHRPPSRGARRGHAKQKTVAAEPEGADSSPAQTREHEEEGREEEGREEEEKKEVLWVKRKDPSGSGHVVLSHIHRGAEAADDAAGTAVEVRIRGEPLDVGGLAKVGLPQDMSELAVTTGEVVAGVGSGGNKEERRKQRAAAH